MDADYQPAPETRFPERRKSSGAILDPYLNSSVPWGPAVGREERAGGGCVRERLCREGECTPQLKETGSPYPGRTVNLGQEF